MPASSISLTARLAAYMRQFTDIPFAIVAAATDRPMYSNAFDSVDDLYAFLGRTWLSGRSVNQLELVPHLVSPGALHLPQALPGLAGQAMNLWLLSAAPNL